MSAKAQLAGAWSGIVFIIVFFIGFLGLAGFVPPPSPQDSGAEISRMFSEDTNWIRAGLILCLMGAGLLLLWSSAIATQLRRIEGNARFFTYAQIVGGACFVLEFVFPLMVWQVAAFRPEDTENIQRLNDLAWIPFLGAVSTAMVQGYVIAAAILMDKREQPILPRWLAYFSICAVSMFTPAGLIVFFKNGPFAWNGFVSWWLVVGIFSAWMVVISVSLIPAIKRQIREEEAEPPVQDVQTELRTLRTEIDALRRNAPVAP